MLPHTSFVFLSSIVMLAIDPSHYTSTLPGGVIRIFTFHFNPPGRVMVMGRVYCCPRFVSIQINWCVAHTQHFVDGTLPKIAQAYELLRRPEVKLLLYSPRSDVIIKEMLRALNISEDRIVWHSSNTVYRADYMIFTCVTPPLHPSLWLRARKLLGVADRLQVRAVHNFPTEAHANISQTIPHRAQNFESVLIKTCFVTDLQ